MKIQFKVKRRLSRDDKTNYTIFSAKVLKYEGDSKYPIMPEMIFKGKMPLFKEKDTYTAHGEVQLDKNRGSLFFYIEKIEAVKMLYEEEIVRFIQKYTNRIPKEMIEKIVEAYGVNTIEVIGGIDGYNKIKELNIPKLGDKRIVAIREAIISNKNYENVMTFLELNNLPVDLCNTIVDNLGKNAILDLQENPYKLINYIDFKTLDKIAYKYIKNARNINRIVAGIIAYVKEDITTKGNVYTEKQDLIENIDLFFKDNGAYPDFNTELKILEDAFNIIKEQNLLKMIEDNGITYIYRKDMSFMEKRVAERIVDLCKYNVINTPKKELKKILHTYQLENNIELDECQIEAVLSVMSSNLSVLSGGPGTGKTFTTNLIKTIYRTLNPNDKILLLAPTGKASKRLSELCGEEAMTIHRGLKIRPLENVDEDDKLDYDFIIIDEASMVDLQMLYNLLIKIDDNTKVLFVGDYNQLPSVGAGLILRDLMNCEIVNVVKLQKIFRQALTSNIVYNSHRMIEGDTDNYKFEKDTFLIDTKEVIRYSDKILKIVETVEKHNYTINDVVILTPKNDGYLGVEDINKVMQDKWNTNNDEKAIYKINDVRKFKVGDKVMHTKNNYDLEVFNGEVGRVIDIIPDESITVDYFDRIVCYNNKETIRELKLAYAMTVHKSQGSEYPIVINIVHNTHSFTDRNLLYTAWTRAKDKLYLVGTEDAIINSAIKNNATNRKSRLVELVKKIEERKEVY